MTLWQELRRRQMFRLAGLYIVGTWLVLQVADVVFPIWDIPESAKLYLIYAAILCSPIALVFGWIFDVTKEGIFRTKRAGPDELVDFKLQKVDYAILTVLFVIGGAILFGSAEKIQEQVDELPAAVELRPNSVAVLPFENLDDDPETGYFSDGVTEEILTKLSNLGGLQVTSRNSSFMFRNSAANPSEISDQLGVRYLLSGSVRRDNNLVRITARLIDFQGFQLWAASYDRDFSEILDVQAEIATTVSSQISTEIIQTGTGRIEARTINPEAYDAYLFARALIHTRTENWVAQAAEVLEKAIQLEPDYAPPHALLSIIKAFAGRFRTGTEEVRRLAHRALELDPNLAEAHLAIGFLYLGDDNQRAIESFRRSLELDPSLTMAYSWLTSALEDANRIDEMFAVQREGLAVDPLNPILVVNVARRHYLRGEQQQAERLYLRLVNAPNPAEFVGFAVLSFYENTGRFDEKIAWLKRFGLSAGDKSRTLSDQDIAWYVMELAFAYLRLGSFDKAADWRALASAYASDELTDHAFDFTTYISQGNVTDAESVVEASLNLVAAQVREFGPDERAGLGMASILVGYNERGIELLEPEIESDAPATASSRGEKTAALERNIHLAFAYHRTGRDDDAVELLERTNTAIEAFITSRTLEIPEIYESAALVRALRGDRSGARDALARAIGLGWFNYDFAVNDPIWAQAFAGEDLPALLANVKTELDRQRAVVEAADELDGFRAEIEPLLARIAGRQ